MASFPNKPIPKDPDADLDYTWDWGTWLPTGDTIDSYAVDIPAGLTAGENGNAGSTTTTVVQWLQGGDVGALYAVRCRIVTTQGREEDRTIYFLIGER